MKDWLLSAKAAHIMVVLIIGTIFFIAILGSVETTGLVNGVEIPIYSKFYKGCYFVRHFGQECPTCGMTRGFYAFFDGEFLMAWNYNFAVVSVIIMLGMTLINSCFYLLTNHYNKTVIYGMYGSIAIAIVTFVIRYVTLMRNIIDQ